MKKTLLLLACSFAFVGCGQTAEPTIEEQVMIKAFSGYIVALTWDEICNGTDPKSRFQDFSKPENVMLMGNRQLFGARLGGVLHVRHPDKPVDEVVKMLTSIEEGMQKNVRAKLEEEGCDGKVAQSGSKLYTLYSKTHASQIYGFIDKSIVDAGGVVTTAQEIEDAGKPVKTE